MNGWFGFGRAMALACALVGSGTVAAVPAQADLCRLTLTSHYVGARAVPAVRRAVATITRRLPIRWIAPGHPIKADFDPRRLNVILDDTGRIMAMRCG